MLEDVESEPWSSFAQPARNTPSSIPDALRKLAAAEVEHEARAAYQQFLFAVGDGHAGTYYPVVIHTLPFLEEVLRGAGRHARNATLDVLIDLSSFEPEREFQWLDASAEPKRSLRAELRERMKLLAEPARTLALDLSEEYVTRKLATDLLELLE